MTAIMFAYSTFSFHFSQLFVATVHSPTLVRAFCIIGKLKINFHVNSLPRGLVLLQPICIEMDMMLCS